MTFEEWYQHRLVEFDGQHPSAAVVWNAAIASSLNAVDAVYKSNIDENDVFVYIYEDLKKLLTS